MTGGIMVAIPLCDYESITTAVWHRSATHHIVRACLESYARQVRTPHTLFILADRCTDRFVRMAEAALTRFEPKVIDNSTVRFGLDRTGLPENLQHSANQFLTTIDLAAGFDLLYYCEQDYLFRCDGLAHAAAAFEDIPQVNLLSLFDHPDRHRPDREPLYGRHQHFETRLSRWKSVSSTNANWMWRVPFAEGKRDWLEGILKHGGVDFDITSTLRAEGELLLNPTRSLIQHYRLDGSNASPTFGFSARLAVTRPIGRAIANWRRLSSRVASVRRMATVR
jgi:hypothetical protein